MLSKKRLPFLLMLLALHSPLSFCQTTPAAVVEASGLDFHASPADPYANPIHKDASRAILDIQSFFGAPFPGPIHFRLVSQRAEFDAAVSKFGLSPTQCWMVGFGTADSMVVLSPAAWKEQACEHDANDVEATQQLLTHELIHVYHGQFNPTRDFTGVDDLDWFIEGLAVFGSGQLTKGRLDRMRAAIADNQAPEALSKVWTGPNRYAFAGSLVRYVDQKWGRATIVRLLRVRSSAEALAILHTEEKSLLAGWRASLAP